MSPVIIVAVVLWIGWGVWWWLTRAHADGLDRLEAQIKDFERQHESR
jgi:uncharacterized membrane protein YqiK